MSFLRTFGHTLLSCVCIIVAVELYHVIEITTLLKHENGDG